jgi:uncharacterized lipoprotein YmbA
MKMMITIGVLGLVLLGGCAGSKDAATKTKLRNTADAPINQQKQRQ